MSSSISRRARTRATAVSLASRFIIFHLSSYSFPLVRLGCLPLLSSLNSSCIISSSLRSRLRDARFPRVVVGWRLRKSVVSPFSRCVNAINESLRSLYEIYDGEGGSRYKSRMTIPIARDQIFIFMCNKGTKPFPNCLFALYLYV